LDDLEAFSIPVGTAVFLGSEAIVSADFPLGIAIH
jgi:hypothetical protein